MSIYTLLNVISLVCLLIAMVLMGLSNTRMGKKSKNKRVVDLMSTGLFVIGVLLLPVASLTGQSETYVDTQHNKDEEDK